LNFFFNMPGSLWKSTTFAKNKAMTLIRSISGIRGTIGGKAGDSLTPADVVRFTGAYAEFLRRNSPSKKLRVVLGRDARISGRMVSVTGPSGCVADARRKLPSAVSTSAPARVPGRKFTPPKKRATATLAGRS